MDTWVAASAVAGVILLLPLYPSWCANGGNISRNYPNTVSPTEQGVNTSNNQVRVENSIVHIIFLGYMLILGTTSSHEMSPLLLDVFPLWSMLNIKQRLIDSTCYY